MKHKFLLMGQGYEWDSFVADEEEIQRLEITAEKGEYIEHIVEHVDFITSTSFKQVYGDTYERVQEHKPRIDFDKWYPTARFRSRSDIPGSDRLLYEADVVCWGYFVTFLGWADALAFIDKHDAVVMPTQYTSLNGAKIFGIAV